MNETGKRNPACGIDAARLATVGTVHYNLAAAALTEQAIRRGEARLTAPGEEPVDAGPDRVGGGVGLWRLSGHD